MIAKDLDISSMLTNTIGLVVGRSLHSVHRHAHLSRDQKQNKTKQEGKKRKRKKRNHTPNTQLAIRKLHATTQPIDFCLDASMVIISSIQMQHVCNVRAPTIFCGH